MANETQQRFADRSEAGKALASGLGRYARRREVIVLALPRGGVPVAYEVAEALDAPLDIFLVRKIGMPGHREYAIGAIASGGIRVLNDDVIQAYGIPAATVDAIAREEERELARRARTYRTDAAQPDLHDRIVILVDDGLATGSSMTAAVRAVRQQMPARVVVAVPVGAPSTCHELAAIADEVVCVRTPEPFSAVGQWYVDFSQTEDAEVRALLAAHAAAHAAASVVGGRHA